MGESSAYPMRSFLQPSPTSSDEKKGTPLQRALTTSISFGRFMSESLDWEKWSAFTHNRYLEEVEKYSRPGSVAEKKAYFEAHFKRRRAAALLEQQNAAANDFSETNTQNDEAENMNKGEVQNSDQVFPVDRNGSYGASVERRPENGQPVGIKKVIEERAKENCQPVGIKKVIEERAKENCQPVGIEKVIEERSTENGQPVGIEQVTEERTLENGQPLGIEKVIEPTVSVGNPVGLINHLGNDGVSDITPKKKDELCDKDDSATRNSASASEKKREVSSSKVSTNCSAPKCAPSVKPIMPIQVKNIEKTPESKSSRRDSGNKRRSYTTALHMSINFASCSNETQHATSLGLPKIPNTQIIRAPAKKYKNSVVSQTSTRASVNGIFKHHLATLPAENRRTITAQGDPILGSRTVDGKVQSLFTNYSKTSNTVGSKARLPTLISSFTFKSEERAEKRKEFFKKLEEKLKSKEAEKQKPRAKSQVKPSSFTDLCSSIAFRATKNAEASPATELSNNIMKKLPTVKTAFPKVEERAPLKVQNNNDTRPPWRLSMKTEWPKDASGKNNRPPICSNKGFSRKSTSENASPNVPV